jgi:cytidine deaminase
MLSPRLFPQERRVLDAALAQARALRGDPDHTVAAAAMDATGRIFTGVNTHHFTGGPCAELVVLSVAAAASAAPLVTIVAVGDQGRGVLAPCGRCRQVLLDQQPDCLVVMPATAHGAEPGLARVRDLLPGAYRYREAHPERVVRFASRYHEPVAAGRKTATVRYDEDVEVGSAWFLFEDDAGYHSLRGVVDSVDATTLDALDDSDARREDVPGADDLRAGLRGHYPGLADDAPVAVVRFHLTDDA